jgi:hypothetical protein
MLFEKRMERKMHGTYRQQITEFSRKERSQERNSLYWLYSILRTIEVRKIGLTGHVTLVWELKNGLYHTQEVQFENVMEIKDST